MKASSLSVLGQPIQATTVTSALPTREIYHLGIHDGDPTVGGDSTGFEGGGGITGVDISSANSA